MDQELIDLRDEEADTDDPITDRALTIADEVLAYSTERPTIAPDSGGGIVMEWMNGDKTMRVRIHYNGLNSYIYTREGNKESQLHPLQKTKCVDSLAWLTEV